MLCTHRIAILWHINISIETAEFHPELLTMKSLNVDNEPSMVINDEFPIVKVDYITYDAFRKKEK